jgi:hypothetical protein
MLQNLMVFRLEVLDTSHFYCFYGTIFANFKNSSYKIVFTRFSSLLLVNIKRPSLIGCKTSAKTLLS